MQPGSAEIAVAAHDRGQMQMAVIALQRPVARRVAVDAARMQ